MNSISVISKSKVVPTSLPAKENNFVNNELNFINQSKFLIFAEALLGINRIYLLKYNKLITTFSILYSLTVSCAVVVYAIKSGFIGATFKVLKYAMITENSLFVLLALTSSKNKLEIFFKNISTFDETLNIQNDLAVTSSIKRVIAWTTACVLCNVFETFLLATMLNLQNKFIIIGCFLVMSISHDIEQVFFFSFLRDIYMRILILKAHVAKSFDDNKKPMKLSKVEKLSEKMQFDVSALHRVYELLHKCSEQLNSSMNIPILIILSVSALSSIFLLKQLISLVQMENPNMDVTLSTIYVIFRCVKYTILVVSPCYYSSVTAGQTTIIRTILHDAVNNMPMSKTERRKVKTFFHLTRESDFSYAICGVIKLNMSLPLSYMSLCTTYLVIIIQFSKFID